MNKILLLLYLNFPLFAWACSCAPASLQEQLSSAERVYIGLLHSSEVVAMRGAKPLGLRGKFLVEQAYKGEQVTELELGTAFGSANCGVTLVTGRTYLLMFSKGSDSINSCSGSQLIAGHKKDEIMETLESFDAREKSKAEQDSEAADTSSAGLQD